MLSIPYQPIRLRLWIWPVFIWSACWLWGVASLNAGPRYGGFKADITGSVSIGYDTNIRTSQIGREDFIYNGSLDINVGPDRQDANWDFNLGTDLFRFSSEDEENSNDFRAIFSWWSSQPRFASRFQNNGSLGWTRSTEADPQLGTRVQRDRFDLSASSLYTVNSKLSWSLNGSYNWEDPRGSSSSIALSELTTWSAGLTGFYRYSEKLAYTLSTSYSDTSGRDSGNPFGTDNSGWRFSLGLDGQISPKVSGTFSVGWQFRDSAFPGASDDLPYFSSGLTWQIDRRSSLGINGSIQFGTTLDGALSEDLSLSLQYSRRINSRLNGGLSLGWSDSNLNFDGGDRADERIEAGARFTYDLNEWLSLNGRYTYSDQTSSTDSFAFDRQLVELSLSFRY